MVISTTKKKKTSFGGSDLQRDLEKGDPRVKESRESSERITKKAPLPQSKKPTVSTGNERVGETTVGGVVKDVAGRILKQVTGRDEPKKNVIGNVVPIGFGGAGVKGGGIISISKTARGRLGLTPLGGGVAQTTRANQLGGQIAAKSFSKATAIYGGVAAWVASVAFGLWGAAEAPEPISIAQTKFLIPEARRTGDWSKVDEAELLKEEILDYAIWEKILLFTPLSGVFGSLRKLEGNVAGAAIISRYVSDEKIAQETGETEDEKWSRIREDEKQQETDLIDYYNTERQKMVQWENEAKAEQRSADATFWAREREKQRKKEEEDRKAIADFWLAYRKEAQKINDDARPSNLKFGLL